MTTEKEVTAQNLRFVRAARGLNQEEVAGILGVPQSAISKIEKGNRSLSEPEKALLDLYFFGIVPKGVSRATGDTRTVLEFTEDEWRVIEILAKRAGLTSEKWIASKIREYLTWSGEARQIIADSHREEKSAPEGAFSSAKTVNEEDWVLKKVDAALARRKKTQPSSDA